MRARDDIPAGAGDRATPAGGQGEEFRRKVSAAQAAWNAAKRRSARRPRTARYRAGMARRPPPPPDGGDDAA